LQADAARTSPAAVDFSIVIPCYRDAEALPAIFERLGPVMKALPGSAELILVDDGSPDGTGRRAAELASGFDEPVTVVRLARNFGQHAAVFAGFEQSRGRAVVTLDSDLQYPPEQIPELVGALSEEYPVVSGYRADRRDPFVRRMITGLMSRWLGRQTGVELRDYGSMFRAYDRSVVERLLQLREHRRYIPALVGWLGVPVREIPVEHEARGEQGSRYRLMPLIDMFLDLVTGYSTSALRVVTLLGLTGAVLGFLATMTFVVYRIVAGAGVSGLITAFAMLFLLLAIVLFAVAMLGEYVGRVYIEVRNRPYYMVEKVERNR
jgi:undecaprenyl-phosphate 4-deoxy-4-formamido-L-arabinose transferase